MSSPPRIHTLTGNLLWERTFEFSSWEPGATQRARRESAQVGGKGINVAKMLLRLGAPATALCFSGGETGRQCEAWLRATGIPALAFPTAAPTRTGLVVRAENSPETTFLGPDAPPDAAAIAACASHLDGMADGDILALCGSLPGWPDESFSPLRAALRRRAERGILVVDTYGPPLAWLAQLPAALVKVNHAEFGGLTGSPLPASTLRDRLLAAHERWPAKQWCVTDGSRPCALLDAAGVFSEITPPAVREISATGSGDVFLAALLQAHFLQGRPLAAAAAYAARLGAANAAHAGIADFPLSEKALP